MKASYWAQGTPDADDGALKRMISEGVVPAGCLWGGLLVEHLHKQGDDPCSFCECPKRNVCGGRERKVDRTLAPATDEHISPGDVGVRKLQRAQFIAQLRRMMANGEK